MVPALAKWRFPSPVPTERPVVAVGDEDLATVAETSAPLESNDMFRGIT